MEIKLFKLLLTVLVLLVSAFLYTPLNFSGSQVSASDVGIPDEIFFEPFSMPGRIEGTSAYFEIKDSQYLNIVLKSTEEIKIVLESIPRMISINIEASATTSSVSLTLEGLEPNKTYYQYQDSYKNGAVFISNSNESFSWGQDLTQPHHIWFQEIKGTVFLPEQCSTYGTWNSATSTCTLNRDLTQGIEITANNITLDCNGHSIVGTGGEEWSGGYGIYWWRYDTSYVTIKNCDIAQFSSGIGIGSFSFSNNIIGNNVSNNYKGIALYSSSNNIINNIVSDNNYGIYASGFSHSNTVADNNIESNKLDGILVWDSSKNNIRNNTISSNPRGIFLYFGAYENTISDNTLTQNGLFVYAAYDNWIEGNTVNGKPLVYLENISNYVVGDAGQVIAVKCDNITVGGLNLSSATVGIQLVATTNSKIMNNTLSNNLYGIYGASASFITNNTITANTYGIYLGGWNNIITNNSISNNSYGIRLYGSLNNTITNNIITGNEYGVFFWWDSLDNLIYHNNFINNTIQAYYTFGGITNTNRFDNGYPSGGNYWSDYIGVDEKSGQNPDQPRADGIGDTSYIFEGGQDRYPFMKENGWGGPPPEEPEKWSFAIITDLHIGRGYLDYGGEGYDDYAKPWLGKEEIAGQSYYLTERLKKVVKWINENNRMDNIKFAVVLGDITDSGEYSEFKKVKEILDGLEIPYFPLIGNHDVWSWYVRQDGNSRVYRFPEIPVGDIYFNMIFDEVFFEQQFKNLGATWHARDGDPLLQNYAFSYGGINFIALDFIQRDPGALKTYKPVVYDITKNFLKNWLEIPPAGNSSILLSHHPLAPIKKVGDLIDVSFGDDDLNSLEREIAGWEKVMANFAGHIHGLYDELRSIMPGINPIFMNANINYKDEGYVTPGGIPVVTTEILPVASNEQDLKGIIRIIEIKSNDKTSNYDLIKGEFRALNPFFKEIEWSPRFTGFPPRKVWKVELELYAFTKLYPFSYIVNHGDGSEESGEVPRWWWIPPYWLNTIELDHKYPKEGGTYKIEFRAKKPVLAAEEKITRDITLPRWSWGYFLSSPADIVLTDPSGLKISKQISEIPGAFYFETDFDEDGDLDDVITLPERKIGDYTLTLLPESEANVTDVYTLGVLTEDGAIIPLAQNVKISDIPLQPYIVRSTKTEIIPLIPTTVDFNPDALNLKSKGQWVTVYIELPIGHGYEVNMIDLASVMLNGQIRTEAKPTGIGDYDGDGTPDLMVKFNRTAIQSILLTGDKIKITITGNLIDGRLFEGIDLVRVISP